MSGNIPREFIRQLVDTADIADIIGATVKLEKKGANFFGLCPFHNEKTPSFSVNPNKGFFHCFGCGAQGDALGFLVKTNGGDFIAAVEKLAGILGIRVPQTQAERNAPNTDDILLAALKHWKTALKNTPAAINYLKQRGITGETVKRYELGYAAEAWDDLALALASKDEAQLLAAGVVREKNGKLFDYFRRRIIFPIIETNGRVRGFGGRVIRADDEPKYLNSAETAQFSKRRVLYGVPQAVESARQKNRLLICEGYMDVVMLSQAGFGEAVATMGTAATAEQMKRALRLSSNIVFAFDADDAGKKGALRAVSGILPALKDGVSVRFLFMPDGEDPDSFVRRFGADAFEQRIGEAVPLADYLSEVLWRDSEASDDDGKRTAVLHEGERLLRLINAEQAPYWRQLLSERLSARAGMGAGVLQQTANRPPKRRGRQSSKTMRPADKLFLLLCCLSAVPHLIDRFERDSVPLFGADEDTEIINGVLAKLRWNMEIEPPAVPALLEEGGYSALAQQVRDTVARRFAANTDVEAEMEALIKNLHDAHKRQTGKQSWLEKLNEATKE